VKFSLRILLKMVVPRVDPNFYELFDIW
jgi:hypothetical protein